jgi:hypothetical protein
MPLESPPVMESGLTNPPALIGSGAAKGGMSGACIRDPEERAC